eukprot:2712571-Amphidinium_carterae.1
MPGRSYWSPSPREDGTSACVICNGCQKRIRGGFAASEVFVLLSHFLHTCVNVHRWEKIFGTPTRSARRPEHVLKKSAWEKGGMTDRQMLTDGRWQSNALVY